MTPALDLKQYLRLMALLLQSPILFARASLRLLFRGLHYLTGNPDLAWAVELLPPAQSAAGPSVLLLIAKQGRPVFSLLVAQGRIRNLAAEALRAFGDLDSFCEQAAADLDLPLQAVMIDSALFERINSHLAVEPGHDAFFIAGREILAALADRQVSFSPALPEAEMLAALDGEELLAKFGPRFGVSIMNPVRFSAVLRGLALALLSPLTRWRMKKNFQELRD
jgi:hypothetical protein